MWPRAQRLILTSAVAAWLVLAASCEGSSARPTPSPAPTAVGTITPAGGTIALTDGTRVTLPPGATAGPLVVSLSEQGAPPNPLDYMTPAGRPVHLDLHGQQLSQPATLEIPVDTTKIAKDVTEDQAFVAYFDDVSQKWVPAGGTVDLQRRVLVVQITHASWWWPFSWNWEAWTSGLSKLLDLKLTSLFDLGKSATAKCDQKSDHVTVDESGGNNIVRGCIEKDVASSPSVGISNLATFFIGLSASGGGAAAVPKQVLGPGETAGFNLDTTSAPPLTVSANFTQEAMNWFVVDLIVSALPFGDLVPEAGIGTIAHALSETSDLTAATEDLIRGDAVGAAEEIGHFLKDDAVVRALTDAIVAYGTQHGISVMTKVSVSSMKHLLVALTALKIILRSTDFIANYFFNNHSQVAFSWQRPAPTPVPTAAAVTGPREQPTALPVAPTAATSLFGRADYAAVALRFTKACLAADGAQVRQMVDSSVTSLALCGPVFACEGGSLLLPCVKLEIEEPVNGLDNPQCSGPSPVAALGYGQRCFFSLSFSSRPSGSSAAWMPDGCGVAVQQKDQALVVVIKPQDGPDPTGSMCHFFQ